MSMSEDSKTTEDFAQWLKAVERQQLALEQQMQQFTALQDEIKGIAEQANHSPQAAQTLQKLQSVEQSPNYQQLQTRVVEKLQQIEQQFAEISQLGDRLADDKPSPKVKPQGRSNKMKPSSMGLA